MLSANTAIATSFLSGQSFNPMGANKPSVDTERLIVHGCAYWQKPELGL